MKQDTDYLRTRGRYLHRTYRRNWQFVRWFLVLWSLFFFAMFAVAVVDVIGRFAWGFARNDIWNSLLFLAGGGGLWLFTSLIHSFLRAYVRRTYGPEPEED